MISNNLTLAVAESFTAGNLQAKIGSISGASKFFEGGITAYSTRQKVNYLHVNEEHANQINAVSQRVANEMAQGVCLMFHSDFGIGTAGYAEPYPEQNISTPFGHFAIYKKEARADCGEIVIERLVSENINIKRVAMQQFVAEEALYALLQYLERAYPEG